MRVLADFHHEALFHSLSLLFEKRLGWELYRPIGPGWFYQGFWNVYNHPHTVNQFLGLHQGRSIPIDPATGKKLLESECLNLHYTIEDGIYYVRDVTYGTERRAIKLEKFREMEFDIIVSSIPQHIAPHQRLIAECQPKAKHIFQVGNRWKNQVVNNIMASTAPFATGSNVVFYHQEFDLGIFKYEPPTNHNLIHSYVHYMKDPERMFNVATCLPGWQAVTYGAGMQKQLENAKVVGEAMKRSAFTWHYKPGGDGFGHVIHTSYACGRPAIIWKQHYAGCVADALFQDGVTCIDASVRTPQATAADVQKMSQPEEHAKMCEAAYERFNQVVNFDEEFEKIKLFLERLR